MKIAKGIVTLIVAILYGLIYYFTLPTLSLGNLEGFIYIGPGVILAAALLAWWISDEDEYKFSIPLSAIFLFLVVLIIGALGSTALFHSSEMYSQIGTIEEKLFTEDVVEIDNSQIPIVDIKLANKLADKKLGEDLSLGSQMEIGEFTNKQQINGKLFYVAPLEHRSFWKWRSNKQGTSGYVMVSATNPNDVRLVREYDNEPIRLKYLSSACFSSNLKRHIRSNGFRSVGLTEYSFELDDTGRPYWVVTTYKNTTLWSNPEATGIVVCDAQTGECKGYSVKDAPEWVDIIQPESFVKDQLENYGKYVHGIFNFSDKDKLSVTKHMTTVYNEGDCFYYTGMSSVGKDNGTVGFIMVNTRSKEVVMYRMVGATEAAGMKSAEGKVQNMGYDATNPIPINVSGIPTYFCTLKDDEGLVKEYAMLKIEDYSIVATGTTIAETKRAYINAVNHSGETVDFGEEAYGYTSEGIVTRISANIESGDTYYYMILDDDTTKLYLASYMISEELPITREGDSVKVSYIDESNGAINIVSFDNLSFSQEISSKQEQLNQEKQDVIQDSNNHITEVDPDKNANEWDSLTEEEKAKLLKELENEK